MSDSAIGEKGLPPDTVMLIGSCAFFRRRGGLDHAFISVGDGPARTPLDAMTSMRLLDDVWTTARGGVKAG